MEQTSFVKAANSVLKDFMSATTTALAHNYNGPMIAVGAAQDRLMAAISGITRAICGAVDSEGRDPLIATQIRTASADIMPVKVVDGKVEGYAGFVKEIKIKDNLLRVLLFPGGKLQESDTSLAQAAGRELEEETELALEARIKPVGIVDVYEDKGRLPFGYVVKVTPEELQKMRAASDLETAELVWIPPALMKYLAQTEGERKAGRLGHMHHRNLLLGLVEKFGADFDKYAVTQAPKTFHQDAVQRLRTYLDNRNDARVPAAMLETIEKAATVAASAIGQLQGEKGLKWKTVSDDVFKNLEKDGLRPFFAALSQIGAPKAEANAKQAVQEWPADVPTIIGALPCRVVVATPDGRSLVGPILLREEIAEAAFRVFATDQFASGAQLDGLATTITVRDMKRDREESWVNIDCQVETQVAEEKKQKSDEKK